MAEKIVPDTSIIIDGKLTELVEYNKLDDAEIIIPEAVVDELENQANRGRETGEAGLEELGQLQKLAEQHDISVTFVGRLPNLEEVAMADSGRIDALIRNVAEENDATLYTADRVQAQVARAKGVEHKFFPPDEEESGFSLRNYFEEGTMSVHLKQGMKPKAKRGDPGNLEYVEIGDEVMDRDDMEKIAWETFEKAKSSEDGLVEMDKDGATVLQIKDIRIAITRPPFSEKLEITAVRPVVNLTLDDYELSDKFKRRLKRKAEGILVAGAPGHGKSTFAQALASFYSEQGKVVKTMEHPRDLQVGPDITQYAALEDDMANTGDVLLLVRPDYTVFDEVRKTEDFEVFADMRLAGVGMIGVVHASEALDAVQRLIGRVEMGVIPQVVDTVVFIQNAAVAKVYGLELTVKVPTGMTEADLARPVVQVKDFETDEVEYEIYTYGEETVVIPVEEQEAAAQSKTQQLAREQLEYRLQQWVDDPEVEFEGEDRATLYVDENDIPQLIGKGGKNITKIENEVGINLSVEPRDKQTLKNEVDCSVEEVGKSVSIQIDPQYAGQEANIYDRDQHLMTATVGKDGQIRVTKKSDVAGKILGAHAADKLSVYV